MPQADPSARFHRLIRRDRAGCWVWQASVDRHGYGLFTDENRRTVLAHRWAYRHAVSEPPAGYAVHHECENRACVNPDHLAAVPASEHSRLHTGNRGVGVKVFA